MIARMYYHIKAKMRYLDNHSFLFFCLFFFSSPHLFPSNKRICMAHLIVRLSTEAGLVTRQNTDKLGRGAGLHRHRCNWLFGQPEVC